MLSKAPKLEALEEEVKPSVIGLLILEAAKDKVA